MTKLTFHFGAMQAPLAAQLRAAKVKFDKVAVLHVQKDMDAMYRLAIRNYLTEAQKRAFLRKFVRRLEAACPKATAK